MAKPTRVMISLSASAGCEHALEEIIGIVAATIRLDHRIQRQRGSGIIGGGIIVGNAATQCAAIAHLRVANARSQTSETRNGGGAGGDVGMAGRGADPQPLAITADAGQAEAGEIHQCIGHAQTGFHGGDQRVAPGEISGPRHQCRQRQR